MTIKSRLALNSITVLIAMLVVIAAAITGTRLIKSNIHELTQKTTPYQLKALNLQRTLQAHSTNLLGVSTSSSMAEIDRLSSNIPESLNQVKKAYKDMAELSGTSTDRKSVV